VPRGRLSGKGLHVVYPGEAAYSLGKNIEVTPLAKFVGVK
jgi:hypothetical protein